MTLSKFREFFDLDEFETWWKENRGKDSILMFGVEHDVPWHLWYQELGHFFNRKHDETVS